MINAQQAAALEKSLIVRQYKAQLKKDLKTVDNLAESIIWITPIYLKNTKLYDFLLWIPGWGPVKRNKLMSQCHIPDRKFLINLTNNQKRTIVNWIKTNKVKHKK